MLPELVRRQGNGGVRRDVSQDELDEIRNEWEEEGPMLGIWPRWGQVSVRWRAGAVVQAAFGFNHVLMASTRPVREIPAARIVTGRSKR